MEFVKIYYDITKEIEILELRLMDLENELRAIRKVVFTGMAPSDPLPVHVPLDKSLTDYDSVVAKIRETSERLSEKKLIRQRVEDNIRDLKGIEQRVAYLRDIEGMTLKMIAYEIGYSYDHVRRISSGVRKIKRR